MVSTWNIFFNQIQNTSILCTKSVLTGSIIREVTQIELHMSNMKWEHGFCPDRSWKPWIYTLKNTGSLHRISCEGHSNQAARPGVRCPFQGLDTAHVRASILFPCLTLLFFNLLPPPPLHFSLLLCREPILVFLFIPINCTGEICPLRSSVSLLYLSWLLSSKNRWMSMEVRSHHGASRITKFHVPWLLVELYPNCFVWMYWAGGQLKQQITAAVVVDSISSRGGW